MGIETTLANRKGKEFCELPKVTNSNSKARKGRRRQKKMSPVQKLFETCKEVFASGGTGIVPPSQDIQRIRSVLVVCSSRWSALSSQEQRTLIFVHRMGIFCLPPSGVIPLHNHPGMTVFSKLLFGTMHIKSYDWVADVPHNTSTNVDSSTDTIPDVRLAKVKVDSDFTAPCNTSILYPADGGNMHCFTAVTACAVLDVLGPPYSDPDGRHCTYYHAFPFSDFSVDGVTVPEEEKESYAWLQEREILLEDLPVGGAPYTGPKIVES
ncbi:Cysteine oxygenase/2-aminoethanethiol dioxygenase [Trema orientale]|uniref:cysteine dioxygenase n=1 Tax=Trema orientale TaxID=63057 RepID=A0A2P5FDM6_TREOI|nr:Cysteine oxygenase/2-aminoethanethiol dioxygenase [Trema orientale]